MSSTESQRPAYARWNPNTWQPWQRNQWAIYASVLISFLSPFLPQYVEHLGIHDPGRAALWSGLLVGISPLLGGILTPFWVRTAEWTGNRILILRCLVAWIFILSAMGFVTNVWHARSSSGYEACFAPSPFRLIRAIFSRGAQAAAATALAARPRASADRNASMIAFGESAHGSL